MIRGSSLILVKDIAAPRYKITLRGDMFKYTIGNGLYLSGSNSTFNTEFLDFYSKHKNLSAFYPGFSGTPIDFSVLSNNQLEFNLPRNIVDGSYDIIFCNPAGYVKASTTPFFKGLSAIIVNNAEPNTIIKTISNENNILTISGNNIIPI